MSEADIIIVDHQLPFEVPGEYDEENNTIKWMGKILPIRATGRTSYGVSIAVAERSDAFLVFEIALYPDGNVFAKFILVQEK